MFECTQYSLIFSQVQDLIGLSPEFQQGSFAMCCLPWVLPSSSLSKLCKTWFCSIYPLSSAPFLSEDSEGFDVVVSDWDVLITGSECDGCRSFARFMAFLFFFFVFFLGGSLVVRASCVFMFDIVLSRTVRV